MKTKLIKILTLIGLLLVIPGAWAETLDCKPITTLPAVIKYQGIYCFTGNLTTNMNIGNAIEIQTNNVTIDLNGWKLGGLAAGAGTQTYGIYADQRKNITIRNGTIRGFYYGILLNDLTPYTTSQGHLIEDVRADKNTYTGINVRGRGNIVRRNQVVDTGGSTVSTIANGIHLLGPGARALNNDISGAAATGTGYSAGIRITNGDGAVVEGNRIDDMSSFSTSSYGLIVYLSNDVLVAGNRITSAYFGISFSSGGGGSTGKYMDNLTSNVTTPFTGGIDAGGNN